MPDFDRSQLSARDTVSTAAAHSPDQPFTAPARRPAPRLDLSRLSRASEAASAPPPLSATAGPTAEWLQLAAGRAYASFARSPAFTARGAAPMSARRRQGGHPHARACSRGL
jgi:hypothetical protein